jgi:hypothetical protein
MYVGTGPVHVRGARSGRTYQVAASGELLYVQPEDVAGLLRMGLFRQQS